MALERLFNRPPSKFNTFVFSLENRRFPMPNLVLKTIMRIKRKKVYGAGIFVFTAPSLGATSGLSLSAVFTHFYQFCRLAYFVCTPQQLKK